LRVDSQSQGFQSAFFPHAIVRTKAPTNARHV
jgi:hypothetical protein